MNHNNAILVYLLKNNNRWVSIKDVRDYTAGACKSECYKVGTRMSDLRVKYGYPIINDKKIIDGVVHSSYKMELNRETLVILRSLWPFKKPPHYSSLLGPNHYGRVFNKLYQ